MWELHDTVSVKFVGPKEVIRRNFGTFESYRDDSEGRPPPIYSRRCRLPPGEERGVVRKKYTQEDFFLETYWTQPLGHRTRLLNRQNKTFGKIKTTTYQIGLNNPDELYFYFYSL